MSTSNFSGIILAAGKGTRFRSVTGDRTQKVLYKLCGKPLIKWSVEEFLSAGVSEIIVNVGYKEDDVRRWFDHNSPLPCKVLFHKQKTPAICTAIAECMALSSCENFIICNGDEIREGWSMSDMLDFHAASGAECSILSLQSKDLYRHAALRVNALGQLHEVEVRNLKYKDTPDAKKGICGGVFIIKRRLAELFDASHDDFWNGFFLPVSRKVVVSVFESPDTSFFNVGTMEELKRAELFFSNN